MFFHKILRRVFILSEDLDKTDQSETSIMKLAYAKNNIIADKKRRNFFKNFYTVLPRSTHQAQAVMCARFTSKARFYPAILDQIILC